MASNSNVSNRSEVRRGPANFKPSIWHYDDILSLNNEYYKNESYINQSKILKEEVRGILSEEEKYLELLELIDVFQRLGVAYHFKDEIKNILDKIYKTESFERKKDLYATSLEFRLLRQHGYNISADVFDPYLMDGMSDIKDPNDVEGILSLYEASFHAMEGETILDNARDFTSKFLKEYLSKNNNDDDSYIYLLINHALEFPLHWRVPRLEAQWFINVYKTSPNMSPLLLQFAKLDFNMVQSFHLEELKHSIRWWKRTSLASGKLSYARDRLVECYFWAFGMHVHPDFGYFRTIITKANALLSTIDDTYDTFATLEDLELFTEAVERWDLSYAMDNLPDYMKICFLALFNFVNEMSFQSLKDNGFYIAPYLQRPWKDVCKTYLVEAKWYFSGYTPSLEEYLENGWISIALHVDVMLGYFSMPNTFRKEELTHFNKEEYPNIIRLSGLFCRLVNDLGSAKREVGTGDVPSSIQWYMKENGVSEEEAREHISGMMWTTWKKLNKEVHDSCFSRDFIDSALDLARISLWYYQHGDGYTCVDHETKNRILSLIMQPIP